MNGLARPGTKFWAFLAVVTSATVLAYVDALTPEYTTLIGALCGAFFGFQAAKDITLANGTK
jgi:hypothetical protein